MTHKSYTVAGILLCNNDRKYLLVQERLAKVYGKWNIPAGHMDEGESPEETARRELREELGIDIAEPFGRPLFTDFETTRNRHYYIYLVSRQDLNFTINEDELLDAQWLSFEDIEKLSTSNQLREGRDGVVWRALMAAKQQSRE